MQQQTREFSKTFCVSPQYFSVYYIPISPGISHPDKDLRIWKDPIIRLQTAIKTVQEESNLRQLGATQIAICDQATT